jgi:hypothetical protein|tara:strand:+ start:3045 stop:3212 length:168 start_codon:yes stop_codon:yes gene_type:complete
MITVKKEYLQKQLTGYKLTLGDMNQNQLFGVKEKYPQYFETQKKKKKKNDTGFKG